MNLKELKDYCAARAEHAARWMYPAGKKMGSDWVVGDVDGQPGKSFRINIKDKPGVFADFSTGEKGGDNFIELYMRRHGVQFKDAAEAVASHFGVVYEFQPQAQQNGKHLPVQRSPRVVQAIPQQCPEAEEKPEVEWPEYPWGERVAALTDELLSSVAAERGWSSDFAEWLHDQALIGSFEGKIAFPAHDHKGRVVRCHYRDGNNWWYHPKDMPGATLPMVVGDPRKARETHVHESQWDALAVADRMGLHQGKLDAALYITRGSKNRPAFEALTRRLPCGRPLFAWPQNDPESKRQKDGLTPSDFWLKKVEEHKNGATFYEVKTPSGYKDANDWTRDGATLKELKRAMYKSLGTHNAVDLLCFDYKNDPNVQLGGERRWVCKGGSVMWVGYAGTGKSTLSAQAALTWATGESLWGIKPVGKMKSLIIQAENDHGDLAEMIQGVVRGMLGSRLYLGRDEEIMEALEERMIFKRDLSCTGKEFADMVGSLAAYHKPDFVWVDPLLSFAGDDIMQQKVATEFLRKHLNPVSERHGFSWMVMHHAGKPPKQSAKAEADVIMAQYQALGSSEFQNWPRAINFLQPVAGHEDLFVLQLSKRGKRAGAVDADNLYTRSLYLKHGANDLVWEQSHRPAVPEEEEKEKKSNWKRSTFNVEDILQYLQHGEYTPKEEWRDRCIKETRMSSSTWYGLFRSLLSKRMIYGNDDKGFKIAGKGDKEE